jgi:NAD-dependent DNA ligase
MNQHVFSLSRQEASQQLQRLGAKFKTSVSSKTTVLIKGSAPGRTKLGMAEKREVPILDLDKFTKELGQWMEEHSENS